MMQPFSPVSHQEGKDLYEIVKIFDRTGYGNGHCYRNNNLL